MRINLRIIAESMMNLPPSQWPQHDNRHRSTLLGDRLEDEQCLRCHLESVATEKAMDLKKHSNPKQE